MAQRIFKKGSVPDEVRKIVREHYDKMGYSRDPVERAKQISDIMTMADSGDEEARKWIEEYDKNHILPPLFESYIQSKGSVYKNNVHSQNIDTDNKGGMDLDYLTSELFESNVTIEDNILYNKYMDKVIVKANKGDKKSLGILEKSDYRFVSSEKQPFNLKLFDSYQEQNRFIIAMEENFLPSFNSRELEIEETLVEKYRYSKRMLAEIGRAQLYQEEMKKLKREKDDLVRTLRHRDDDIRILRKDLGQGEVYENLGKIPPQAIDLEEIILGSAIKTGRLVEDFNQPYANLMFCKEAHKKVHQALMDINGKITFPKLIHKLLAKRTLEETGGPIYIDSLMKKGIDDEKILKEYFGIMENKYMRREAIRVSTDIINEAYKEDEVDSVPEWVRKKTLEFFDIMPYRFKIYYDLKSIVGQTIGNFRKLIDRNGRPEISTGYQNLDRITHGITPGTLNFIGMRGKNGKTTVTTNIADNVALQNRHVLIFTYETSREEVIQKLIAKRARVDLEKMVYYDDDNPLTESEKKRIYKASLEVRKLPIIIEGRPAEPEYITRMTKFYKGMYPDLSLVIIDGLQAFTKKEMPKGKNKSDYLYDTLTGFKNELAIDLNLSVWVNGQLKSIVEERKSKRPIGSGDYSDCKGITEVADVAMLGYRAEKYFDGPQFKGWIAMWPTDTRSGTEHGRACRLGFETEFANVYELPKDQRKYDYAKYDALNPAIKKNHSTKTDTGSKK